MALNWNALQCVEMRVETSANLEMWKDEQVGWVTGQNGSALKWVNFPRELKWAGSGFFCARSSSTRCSIVHRFIIDLSSLVLESNMAQKGYWHLCSLWNIYLYFTENTFRYNYTLEAICSGVSVVWMPQWSDQITNANYVKDVWGVGVRVKPDANGIVRRRVLDSCIREVMEGEKSIMIKKNMIKWRG
ncbi:UDP-glycosyltransferase 74G1-like protein [Tanacetum coccineum]